MFLQADEDLIWWNFGIENPEDWIEMWHLFRFLRYITGLVKVVLFPTCIVLCQIFIFVLLLFLAKPSTAGLLLLFGLLHGDASYSPSTQREGGKKLVYSFMLIKEKNHSWKVYMNLCEHTPHKFFHVIQIKVVLWLSWQFPRNVLKTQAYNKMTLCSLSIY